VDCVFENWCSHKKLFLFLLMLMMYTYKYSSSLIKVRFVPLITVLIWIHKSQFRKRFHLTRALALQEERLGGALRSLFLVGVSYPCSSWLSAFLRLSITIFRELMGSFSGLSRGSHVMVIATWKILLLAIVAYLGLHRSIFCELPEGSQGCCTAVPFPLCQPCRSCLLFPSG